MTIGLRDQLSFNHLNISWNFNFLYNGIWECPKLLFYLLGEIYIRKVRRYQKGNQKPY